MMSGAFTQAGTSSVLSKRDRGPGKLSGLPLVLSSFRAHLHLLTLAPFLRRLFWAIAN